MSAFLVSDAHINVLITFAKTQGLVLPSPSSPDTSHAIYNDEIATQFGRALLAENMRSLTYRYGDNHGFTKPLGGDEAYLNRYRYRYDPRGLVPKPGTAIAIIKATHCFDYQSCETPDYAKTWAAELMRLIRDAACHDLPGYESAPWGFEDLNRH